MNRWAYFVLCVYWYIAETIVLPYRLYLWLTGRGNK
jgi:hypothetical protein